MPRITARGLSPFIQLDLALFSCSGTGLCIAEAQSRPSSNMAANDRPPRMGPGKGSHVRGRNHSTFACNGFFFLSRLTRLLIHKKYQKMRKKRKVEEEEEEIHEVGQNSASCQRKPVENCGPFFRLSIEDSGGPNPTTWMGHHIVHSTTQDSANEKNTLGLWGLSHPGTRVHGPFVPMIWCKFTWGAQAIVQSPCF